MVRVLADTSQSKDDKSVDPLNMDSLIISYMNKAGISWADLVKIHNDQRGSKEIALDGIPMDVKEILQYIRSLSRIIIRYNVNLHKTLESNSNFYMIIAGSTNIASDYDVTLVGDKASKVCDMIVSSFRKNTGGDLAEIADSNVYIAPAFVIEKEREYPTWLNRVMISEDQAFPLPASELSIKKEIEAVLKRDGFKDERPISVKYDDMIQKGRQLEDIYYYSKNSSLKESNESDFWKLLHGINFDAMEAYITLSTIIAVVVEMQMKKKVDGLKPIHYLISAFENMINFVDHNGGMDISDKVKLLKNSKYIQRILHCLTKTDHMEKISDIDIENVNYIVSQRGNPTEELYSSGEFGKFTDAVTTIMRMKDDIKRILTVRMEETMGKRKRRRQGKRRTRKIRRSKRVCRN